VTTSVPIPMARGMSRAGFRSSSAANPTLFQASIEKSAPTMAAPITGQNESGMPPSGKKPAPKLVATTSGFRASTAPSTIRAPKVAALMAVRVVWRKAAVRTPRTLIQVSSAIEPIANRRWGETPTSMGPLGSRSVVPRNTSGDSAGTNTAVNRAKATATAAMVPVWITRNKVQPYR